MSSAQPGSYFPHEHPKRCFNFPACPDSFPVVTVIQQAQLEPVASLQLTAREIESPAHRTHSPSSRGPLWAVTGSLLQSVDSSRVGDQGSPGPWLRWCLGPGTAAGSSHSWSCSRSPPRLVVPLCCQCRLQGEHGGTQEAKDQTVSG